MLLGSHQAVRRAGPGKTVGHLVKYKKRVSSIVHDSRNFPLSIYLDNGTVDGVFGTSLDSPMLLLSRVLSATPSSRKTSGLTEGLSH